jgi:hypothetical protein
MGWRPRRLAVGLTGVMLGLLAVLAQHSAEAAPPVPRPARPPVVVAAVSSDGRPQGFPAGWRVMRRGVGRYQVRSDGTPKVHLDVPSWDATARVLVLPLGDGVEVRFVDDEGPVDSAFVVSGILSP